MGMYDFRCAITGISLRGADAVLVGLHPVAGGYQPITFGITGNYNRLGSIDGIEDDLNTDLVHAYFCDRARTGDLLLDPYHAQDYGNPPNDIENLLNYFERNVSDSTEEDPAAALSGRRIFSTLIAKQVWTALAATYAPIDGTPETWFKEIFGDSSIAGDIYRDRIPELATHARDLAAVHSFLATQGLTWTIPDEDEIGRQHYEEMREFLDAARVAFHEVPAVLTALDAYAEEVDDLLNEED
jgi:hypothetical protein